MTLDIANALTTTILELDANDQTIADDAEEDDDEVASGDDDDNDNDELDEMMMGGGGGFINNVPIGAIFQAMLSQVCALCCSVESIVSHDHGVWTDGSIGLGLHSCSTTGTSHAR